MDETINQPDIVEVEIEQLEDTKPNKMIDKTLFEEVSVSRPSLRVALRSDVGGVRQRNEDSCFVFTSENGGHSLLPLFGLYLVADGMGGHESGHLASKIASRVASHNILENVFLPMLSIDNHPQDDAIEAMMAEAVMAAHEALCHPNPSDDRGTTLTVAVQFDRDIYLAHVGDSRAYLLADGHLKTITNDHSLVQRLQDEGQLTAEEAQHYQYRNILLRALGQHDDLQVDTFSYKLPRKGKLLFCSDGLCGLVMDPILQQIMNQSEEPRLIADQLIDAAMAAGGYDNITAIVVEFSF